MNTANKEEIVTRMFALGKLIRARLEHGGPLSSAQLETLRFIAECERPTMREVAEHHQVTAPSTTAHIADLVRRGYLKRVADKKDRRAVRLDVTPLGQRTLRSNMLKRKRILEELFESLPVSDRTTFNRILGNILIEQK